MAKIGVGESFESAIQTMTEYVSEVQAEADKVFEEFQQLAVVEHPWEALYNTALLLETTYNEEVLNAVKNRVNDWAEGEASYVSMCKLYSMGEEAEGEALRQQNLILDEINNIPEQTEISSQRPVFKDTEFESSVVKERLLDISTGAQRLNDIVEEKSNQLSAIVEENELVQAIVSVGITYGNSVANFVTAVTERISEVLSVGIEEADRKKEAALEAAKQEAEKFNQEIEEMICSVDSFLDSLFD